MSTLYLRLPAQTLTASVVDWDRLVCRFALNGNGHHARSGSSTLAALSAEFAQAQRVVVILAAPDVMLLRIQVPPLSAAKLQAALPGLLEEHLLCDPDDCVITASARDASGYCNCAIVERAGLQRVISALTQSGARNLKIVPAQLCLENPTVKVSAAVEEPANLSGIDAELSLRFSQHEGLGLSLHVSQPEQLADTVMQTLRTIVPTQSIQLLVCAERFLDYQQALDRISPAEHQITLVQADPIDWLTHAQALQYSIARHLLPSSDWVQLRTWRWPLSLLALLLIVSLTGLHLDWWRMQREATALKRAMTQGYRTLFPQEHVVIDPVAQLRQKITLAQRDHGQLMPNDFLTLTARFSAAWNDLVSQTPQSKIAALEFHEQRLLVKFASSPSAQFAAMQHALAADQIELTAQSDQLWQLRSQR